MDYGLAVGQGFDLERVYLTRKPHHLVRVLQATQWVQLDCR